jgi:putative ABC transport system ATP-binding protein
MLILADEPTGNLDEANEGIVLDIFKQLHKEGSTLIVVTHDPEVAEDAQRTVILEHGRISGITENKTGIPRDLVNLG